MREGEGGQGQKGGPRGPAGGSRGVGEGPAPPGLGVLGVPRKGQVSDKNGTQCTGPIVCATDPHAVGGGRATWVGFRHRCRRA